MIVVPAFLPILNQMEFYLVQNHDHIPLNVKENGNIVFSVYPHFVAVINLGLYQQENRNKMKKQIETRGQKKLFSS